MTGAQELLESLRSLRSALADVRQGVDGGRLAGQEAAVKRLESCLAAGLPELGPVETGLVADELKQLLIDNRFQLKWAQIQATLAKVGAPREGKAAPRGPRLDLVS